MKVTIRRVLFATDFSEPAFQAQNYACAFASKFNAELHAIHIASDPFPVPGPIGIHAPPEEDLLPRIIIDAENRLTTQMEAAKKANVQIVSKIRVGDPVAQIISYAKEHEIDIIVIGTHGRSGISRLLIGSVAEKVVRLATCPVLTVHPHDHHFLIEESASK